MGYYQLKCLCHVSSMGTRNSAIIKVGHNGKSSPSGEKR
ncbi:hypothetical protein CEV34_2110 [Brucella pseudogrignonensis]|uniref:Uncharacterized protein n=1 Tax=Brucella pseudogrignonensis TaxID=419475 RepID=A0A256GKD9_9HYPH|nr:hypothetical protein CEV34_2110 [Brucella pseudogrignonensis]